MPYSSAEMAVHLPVPFCPALSRILGNSSLPSASRNLRILAVISIRNESSSVLFHSSNAYTHRGEPGERVLGYLAPGDSCFHMGLTGPGDSCSCPLSQTAQVRQFC